MGPADVAILGVPPTSVHKKRRRDASVITLRDAWWIGLAQVGTLIPGVSQSGATLTAALALGFKRDDAARVSFVLGMAAITLAGLKEVWTLTHAGLDTYGWSVLAVGLVVSSLSAFIALWGLMRSLSRSRTWPPIAYRAVFGLILLYSAYKLAFQYETAAAPESSIVLRAVRKVVPSTDQLDGQKLFTLQKGRRLATPLFAERTLFRV